MRIRFGDFVLDSETRQLLADGKSVHISPKGLQLLELLLERRPRAVSKDEIHDRLWPGTFVTEATLTSLLAEVRSAIGDDARGSRYIRTVHRFGYAFSGNAEEEAAAGAPRPSRPAYTYRLFVGLREVELDEGRTVLGRGPDVAVFIDDGSISRRHAQITIEGSRATIEDLGSKNGTRVGAKLVHEAVPLADGDEICLGTRRMTFRILPVMGSTETAEVPGR